jgi:hypothetical protein
MKVLIIIAYLTPFTVFDEIATATQSQCTVNNLFNCYACSMNTTQCT